MGIERVILRTQSAVLPGPEQWLMCGAVAISLLSLTVIHFTTASETTAVRLRSESGAKQRSAAALIVLLIAFAGVRLVPITLAALLALVCASQVVVDFYERERHERG